MAVDAVCFALPSTPQLTCMMKRGGLSFSNCLSARGDFSAHRLDRRLPTTRKPFTAELLQAARGPPPPLQEQQKHLSAELLLWEDVSSTAVLSAHIKLQEKLHRTFSAATEMKETLIFSHYSTTSLEVPQVLKLLRSSRSGQEQRCTVTSSSISVSAGLLLIRNH